jgi:YggT family protein
MAVLGKRAVPVAAARSCPSRPGHLDDCGLTRGNPMLSLFQILMLILNIVWFFIIAHVIMSWLINFQILNLRQQLVAQIWYGLNRVLEPLYSRIRRFLPDLNGIDLAPLVALIAVYALRIVLVNNISAFY